MIHDVGANLEIVMREHFECDALHVQGRIYSYSDLYSRASAIRNIINEVVSERNQFIGIFCYRSIDAYAGIVGTLFSKNAYLPINPFLPPEKINKILEISECNVIILAEEAVDTFTKIMSLPTRLTVICPTPGNKINELIKNNTDHIFIFPDEFPSITTNKGNVDKDDPAYLMFTSGSTGEPKGIVVSHKNLCSYANYIIKEYEFSFKDRISQAPDISFDLSIQDIFSAFLSGGCLFVLPKEVMIAPYKYINEHKLTVWTSVPSVGIFMDNIGQLLPNSLPSLRLTLFCGEGLPCTLASNWSRAAENSKVVNFYGPTEATVMFTEHKWDVETETENCFNGLVSIGKPFNHMKLRLIENGNEVRDGSVGEIHICGQQVIDGYFKDSKLTESKFIRFDGIDSETWYRTGDLAKKLECGNYFFVGRADDQIQVRGHRIEMLEIDNILRSVVGHHMAISIPVMSEDNNTAEDIVAFCTINDKNLSEEKILGRCGLSLAEYMVPSKIYFLDVMPLNQNGKIDKKILYNRVNDVTHKEVQPVNDNFACGICLKGLSEDKKLDGFGLLKVINHDGTDGYICHICFKGF